MEGRKLNNREMADLPSEWGNALVDTSKYHQNVSQVWEVDEVTYERGKREGVFCQEHEGRYYLAA